MPPSCAVVMKSGNPNFVEPSGPLQACNGLANILFPSSSLTKILCAFTFVMSAICPPPFLFDFVILKYYFNCNKNYEASNYAVSYILFLHSSEGPFRSTRNGQNTLKEVNTSPLKKKLKSMSEKTKTYHQM